MDCWRNGLLRDPIEPFQAFEGIEPIKEGINPATWMLEQTGGNVERKLGKDFAELYEQSEIHKCATQRQYYVVQLSSSRRWRLNQLMRRPGWQ